MNRSLGYKVALAVIGAVAVSLVFVSPSFAAPPGTFGNYYVSGPTQSVTMGDPSGTLSFTVSLDAAATKEIKKLFFNIDPTLYDFSAATVAPGSCTNNWNVVSNAACSLPGCISFSSGGGISPGDSCTFDIVVTGAGDTAILSDTQDQTDSLISVVASNDQGAPTQKADFTFTGGAMQWTRHAFAVAMTAAPASTGAGGQIVVTMTVTNRSTVSWSGIVGSPDPPTVGGTGGANVVGSAVYGSTASTTNPTPATLKNDMDAAQTDVNVYSTSGFPTPPPDGTVLIDTELIDYSAISGNQFSSATRGVGGTAAAAHYKWDTVYSQDTSAFTLASGETSTITWIYEATSTGYVNFTASAQDGAASPSATSKSVTSNVVVIGDFTAETDVDLLAVISGQTVKVTMTVYNNGSSTLTDITPTMTPGGTATITLVTGPDPTDYATLGPGGTAMFEWEYTVTGNLGDTYSFTGSADGDEGATTWTTNSASSETGQIVVYAVNVSPGLVTTGETNKTITWTVFNNAAVEATDVRIDISPIINSTCGVDSWVYGSHADPANWTSATAGTPVTDVTWSADPPTGTNGILQGQSQSFSITFSCVPDVNADTNFNFSVIITDKNNNTATIETFVLVTAFEITLEAFDDDCSTVLPRASAPIWDDADGFSTYCFTATLTKGGVAAANEPLSFTTTGGSLSPVSGFTDASGQLSVILTAPCSTADTSPTVTAAYIPDTTASATVTFYGVATPVLTYVPGSLTFERTSSPAGTITSPVSINTADTGYFTVDVTNCDASNSMNIYAADSSLAILSSSSDTFSLVSDTTVAPLATATLTFASGTIASGPLQCYPILTLDAAYGGTDYTGPYAFDKASPGDSITDSVTVSGGTECSAVYNLRMIDWREVY